LKKVLKAAGVLLFVFVGLTSLALALLFLPVLEHNSTTLMLPSEAARIATAEALSTVIGEPLYELNTNHVLRFLFNDGTSVDTLVQTPPFQPLCRVVALKQVVLGFSSLRSPAKLAGAVEKSLVSRGFKTQIVLQPDPAFPQGNIVLVLSDAFIMDQGDGCFAFIIRKNALRVGGPLPTVFRGFY